MSRMFQHHLCTERTFSRSPLAHRHRRPHEPDLMVLRGGGRQQVGGDKVYIEYLHVSKLEVTLSFLPSPGVHSPLWIHYPGAFCNTWVHFYHGLLGVKQTVPC